MDTFPEMPPPWMKVTGNGVVLNIRVQPRSSKNKLGLSTDGQLKAWVQAPPVDSAANSAMLDLLAQSLQIPRKWITLEHGQTSRSKSFRIQNLPPEDILERMGKMWAD
ncbi:MAG: DUF167 domain-containing protein [Verrucomicrobia bacterium]|nr:DUF167 domain-containing protein [Verrucomicrobiota bacterium]